MKYNVLVQDFNSRKFVPYDIFPYLTNMYNREEKNRKISKSSRGL